MPDPVSPPNDAVVNEKKLKRPLSSVSNVVFCKASELVRASVPQLINVSPE